MDSKILIKSIHDDISFIEEKVSEYYPETSAKQLLQDMLSMVRNLITMDSVPPSPPQIPSLRNRQPVQKKNPIAQALANVISPPVPPLRNLGNEWAGNLPDRPGVRPKAQAAPPEHVHQGQTFSTSLGEIYEVPGSFKCPGCGEPLIVDSGMGDAPSHSEDQNSPPHPTTGLRGYKGCTGDTYYIV